MQEESLRALHHLIVSSYSDVRGKSIFFLRRRQPAAVAMACLATTLVLAKDVMESMDQQEKTALLRDSAAMMGILEVSEHADLILCPVHSEQRDPYLKAMEFLALCVWDLQDMVVE